MSVDILHKAVADLPRSWESLDMMSVLIPAVNALPELLSDQSIWKSKYIVYEEPYLMRLYHQIEVPSSADVNKINKVRLSTHYFFGKTAEEICPYSGLENPYFTHRNGPKQNPDDPQLYHFHSWAAGFFLFEGGYKQQIGHATKRGLDARPPVTETPTHSSKDASRAFAFNNPFIWHRVIPQGTEPVCTLMVSFTPDDWGQVDPPPPSLRDLNENETGFMLQKFKHLTGKMNLPLKLS